MLADEWGQVEQSFVLPPDTKRFTVWIFTTGREDVLFAEPSLEVGACALPKDLSGPGVLLATAGTTVRGTSNGQPGEEAGQILFPIPLLTKHQVPLTFDVRVDPPEALLGFRWIPREDGRNWLREVSVSPIGDGTAIRWESLVLVNERHDSALLAAALPRAPEEASAWLRSTACIQSGEAQIVAKAKELRGEAAEIALAPSAEV